jgi:hypothetical protein
VSEETTRLWAAVHAITEPQRQQIKRSGDEAVSEFNAELEVLDSPKGQGGVCHVPDYRRAAEALRLATAASGRVPCLWVQANAAIFGSEAGDGSGGRTSARERTPADLDLMETMLTIRESLGWQMPGRKIPWRKPGDIPDMMRQLAGHIASNERQHVEWWAFRFEQWARLLRNGLNALDQCPKPRYLRNSSCPACGAGQVTIGEDTDARRVVPALVVDFTSQGLVRAAECQACQFTWWRGDDLERLRDQLGLSAPDGMMTA